MKRLSRVMAAFMALSMLAAAPGVQTYSAFAAQNAGKSVSIRTGGRVGASARNGYRASAAQASGANKISLGARLGAAAVSTPAQSAALPASAAQAASAAARSTGSPIYGTLRSASRMTGTTRAAASNLGSQVSAGRIAFDGAKALSASDGSVPAGDGSSDKGPGLTPSSQSGSSKQAAVPAAPQNGSPLGTSKAGTLTDALLVAAGGGSVLAAGGGYLLGAAATYASVVAVSAVRYFPALLNVLADKSPEATSATRRAYVLIVRAGIDAPVLFGLEVYLNLVKPAIDKVVKIVTDLAKAIRDFALEVYNEVLVPLGRWIKAQYKAAVEAFKELVNKAIDLAVRLYDKAIQAIIDAVDWALQLYYKAIDALLDLAEIVKQAFVNLYNDVLVPAYEYLRDLAIRALDNLIQFAKDVAQFVYDNVLVPSYKIGRGAAVGVASAVVAAAIMAAVRPTAGVINFIIKPLHARLHEVAKMPGAYELAFSVLNLGLGAVLAVVAVALMPLVVAGSAAAGAFGGLVSGMREGYRNGLVAGTSNAVREASEVATGHLRKAKTDYANWRMNLK